MARRILIGYQQVETTEQRQFRQALAGSFEDKRPAPLIRDEHADEPEFYWWCAADAPEPEPGPLGFARRAVYRTTKVPASAECEVCGIPLRDLQAMHCLTSNPREG